MTEGKYWGEISRSKSCVATYNFKHYNMSELFMAEKVRGTVENYFAHMKVEGNIARKYLAEIDVYHQSN